MGKDLLGVHTGGWCVKMGSSGGLVSEVEFVCVRIYVKLTWLVG